MRRHINTDTICEPNIICPYCGYEDEMSCDKRDDFDPGSTTPVECPDCGKVFNCEMEVEVTFTTYKKEKENE